MSRPPQHKRCNPGDVAEMLRKKHQPTPPGVEVDPEDELTVVLLGEEGNQWRERLLAHTQGPAAPGQVVATLNDDDRDEESLELDQPDDDEATLLVQDWEAHTPTQVSGGAPPAVVVASRLGDRFLPPPFPRPLQPAESQEAIQPWWEGCAVIMIGVAATSLMIGLGFVQLLAWFMGGRL